MHPRIGWALLALTAISACELPEKPYPAPVGLATEAAMGTNYQNVVYFSLETDTALMVRPRDAYDVRWDPQLNPHGIRINSSGFGRFKRSGAYDFGSQLDTANFEGTWQWSREGSELFAEDLGRWTDWEINGWSPVFAVLPGIDASGMERPMWRIQLRRNTDGISLYFAPFGSPESADSVRWVAADGLQFMRFDLGMVPKSAVEPPNWDFLMGQYVDQDTVPGTGELVPYVVRGVLLPPHRGGLRVRRAWNDLNPEWAYAQELEFRSNVVGYDWKSYSFASASYVTDTAATFLLERSDASRYALRFLDFYSSQGQRGFVQTQWKPL